MKLYQLLKLNQKIKSPTIKLTGILVANLLGFRHLSVRIDPILGCNLSCRMCYFSSPEKRKQLKGLLSEQEIEDLARVMFPRALQLVIGCGAEPTLHKSYIKLAQLAKKYKIPDIGMVTNGQLITYNDLETLVQLGIDEIAFSMHGVTRDVFEKFMVNASYDRFVERLNWLEEIKKKHHSQIPHLRINYTVNAENLDDLHLFFDRFGHFTISTLQVRPVMDIGGTFSLSIMEEQKPIYNQLIERFKGIAKQQNIRFLSNTMDIQYQKKNENGVVAAAVYCYLSPNTSKQLEFEWSKVSFAQFIRKMKWRSRVFKSLFIRQQSATNNMVKYEVIE